MAFVNYKTDVSWDADIKDVGFVDSQDSRLNGLAIDGIKVTTGAPTATVGVWLPSAEIDNIIDGTSYQNTGTTALPVWTLIATGGGGITQLTGDVTASGSGSVVATIAANAVTTGKIANGTILNVDINNAAAIDFAKLANLNPGTILVGSAANVPTMRTMTGDASLSNTGSITVDGINGFVVDTSGVLNSSQDRVSAAVPFAVPQALSGAGALAITSYQTRFTSTATGNALTLADGTIGGQLKKVTYIAEAAGGDTGVITAATGLFTTVTLNAIGDYAVFLWVSGIGWQCIDFVGATVV